MTKKLNAIRPFYRIFSPKGIQLDDDDSSASTTPQDNHPNKMNRGVLRSKIEAGEGTIPAANLYNGTVRNYSSHKNLISS